MTHGTEPTRPFRAAVHRIPSFRSVGAAAIGLVAALAPVVLAGPAAADDDAPGTPEEALAMVDVTPQLLAGSTLSLDLACCTLDLRPSAEPIGIEDTVIDGTTTTTTLTADLLFEFNKADLTPVASEAIAELVGTIPKGAAVAVDGYTDSLGGDDVNLPLSQQRAEAVAAVLASTRPDLVLTTTGHGSADPVAPNEQEGVDNPVARALNRRVELTYQSG